MQGFEHVKTLLGKTLTCDFFLDIRIFYVIFMFFFVHFGIIKDFNRLLMDPWRAGRGEGARGVDCSPLPQFFSE
jgi:hypothetical protein